MSVLLGMCGAVHGDGGVNARDLGAVGDGKADDTAAIRKVIDAACGIGVAGDPWRAARKVILPAGAYRITETITLTPEHNGLQIQGEGGARGYGKIEGCASLVWDGEAGGTLLQCWAMKGLQMADIVLDGSEKAGKLLRVNSTDPSNKDKTYLEKYGRLASTGYTLWRVVFQKAEKGIVLSDDAYICSDCSSFYNIRFFELEVGFEANSEQNLCYHIERPDIGYVGTAFKFRGGGSVVATGVNCHHTDVVFDIEKVGINSGTFFLVNVRPEQGGRKKGKRPVSLKVSGDANVHMVGLQTMTNEIMGEGRDLETPSLILGPSANVLISSSQLTGRIAVLSGSPDDVPTFLTIENSRFRVHADPLGGGIQNDASSGFRLRDCQITLDEEKDGKYRILSRNFITDHLVAPVPKK